MTPFLILAALPAIAAASPTIDAMRHVRRILIVAASSPSDPQLAAQRRLLAGWQQGSADRDLSVVEIIGDHVRGAADAAATLRHRFGLPIERFQVVLVGKDGHEAARNRMPIAAAALQHTIDAMPMRRAGQR